MWRGRRDLEGPSRAELPPLTHPALGLGLSVGTTSP